MVAHESEHVEPNAEIRDPFGQALLDWLKALNQPFDLSKVTQ